jgi:hypothetical protein
LESTEDTLQPRGHFIINSEREQRLKKQIKNGPTSFESWNKTKQPYPWQNRKNKKTCFLKIYLSIILHVLLSLS